MDFPKIVSGGQTGADRAALDWAMANSISHGGWCPLGRLAEDGKIDAQYNLRETPKADYLQRTEWNVRDSDATVIFSISPILTGDSLATEELAMAHRKPCLHISEAQSISTNAKELQLFLEEHNIGMMNVAGPRASNEPKICAFVTAILDGTCE